MYRVNHKFFKTFKSTHSSTFSLGFLNLFVLFTLLLSPNIAYCFDRSFAWDKNTEPDLAGYYIYYKNGSSGAPYNGTGANEGDSPIKIPLASLNDPENPEYIIHNLSGTGTFYFVATAYDIYDNESGYSAELSYQPSAPSANDDSATVAENSGVTNINVIGNDNFGGDGPAAADISISTGPGNGAAAVNIHNTLNDPTDDSIDYTPNTDYNGTDTLTYEICDSNGDCDTALLTITVTPETPAITLTSLSISGDDSVNESSNADYTATALFSDGSSQNVTSSAGWSENSAYASINSVGKLTTSSVPSDQAVTIQASYTYSGATETATKGVTITDVIVPVTLSSLSISGVDSVNESSGAQYTLTANYSDGSSANVTGSAGWSENSGYASIGSSGYLTTSAVASDQSCTITASYGGQSDTHSVTIKNVPPTLTSVTITGSTQVNESSGAQYTLTANYSDGSSANVTGSAGWSENSGYASIGSSGYLTTSAVTSDQSCTITASYGGQSDTHNVTIKNVPPTLTSVTITGSTQVNESSGAQYTLTANYSDGSSANVTGSAGWSENSGYASIGSSGYLTTSAVTSDQSCTITASYGGQSDTHNVTIKNVPPTLTSVTITGSTQVNESSGAQYTLTANYSDGSSANVTGSAGWSENSGYASIGSSGYLTTSAVTSDQSCTITASYGGQSDTHNVTIKNVPPTLTSVTITGSTQVNESSGAQYTLTANYSDGSSTNVTGSAGWSENSSYASIGSSGYLTTSAVASDQSCTITASYGGQSDTHNVTIKNGSTYDLSIIIDGSGNVVLDPDGGTYEIDTSVTLTATANPGWVFSDWSGDLISSDNPATITMNSDKNVTATFLVDSDNDGISDEEEDSGPNGGDGNNDGILDSQQSNVSCLRTDDDQHYVTLETPPGTIISNCQAIDNLSFNDAPSDIEFPYGFFEFTLGGIGINASTTLTLYLPDGETFDTYYKFGPTPNDSSNHWYTFLNDGQTGAEINGSIITLHFVDSRRGDDDLTANGTIIDIGGPGISPNLIPTGSSDSSPEGGGGGCFIATAAFGSLMEPHVKILRDFRDRFLIENNIGRVFVKFYYKHSPPMADVIARHDTLRMLVRLGLAPLIGISWMLLHLGVVQTLLFFLTGIGLLIFYRSVWFRKANKQTCEGMLIKQTTEDLEK